MSVVGLPHCDVTTPKETTPRRMPMPIEGFFRRAHRFHGQCLLLDKLTAETVSFVKVVLMIGKY